MLSKSEKKRLAKEALNNVKSESHSFYIFSENNISFDELINQIPKQLSFFKVNLSIERLDEGTINIFFEKHSEFKCQLSLVSREIDFLFQFQACDLFDEFISSHTESSCLIYELRGQRKLYDETNFIFNTLTRIIGRITEGTLFDLEQEYVGTDWISWAVDYGEENLFLAYNYPELPQKYPYLVKRKKFLGLF